MKRAKKKVAKKSVVKKKTVKAKAKKTAKSSVKKPAVSRSSTQPGQAASDGTVTWNFKLLSHNLLGGFGGMGEGMSVQIAPDGRRIIWLAHESAPKNFTAVDVSDPRKPKVVCQTDLPQSHMRSNSLETCGNIMAVAYQTQKKGLQPAGMELFDISKPENPKSIGFYDCSGEHSRGVHQLWFCDGEYVHMASSSPDFVPTHPQDDQFYRCIDVRNPSKPVEVGRWHMPGTKQGDNVPPPPRHPLDKGYRAHNCNVYPQRPDRCYLAYIDGGMHVLDISDKANSEENLVLDQPAALLRLHAHRGAAVRPRTDAGDRGVHREQRQGLAEARFGSSTPATKRTSCRSRPARCRTTRPMRRARRFGAHNIHENVPLPTCWQSDQVVLGTFFNGGLQGLRHLQSVPARGDPDLSCRLLQVTGAPTGTTQINDVFVDEREVVYCVDRHLGGLYCLEMDFEAEAAQQQHASLPPLAGEVSEP